MTAASFPATSMPDADWWHALWPDPAAVLAKLALTGGGQAVDLCCGDGLFTVPLAGEERHVIALDLDPAMLSRARQQGEAAGKRNISYVAADASELACIKGAWVDLVLIANTFHGVPDKPRLGRAVACALAPGGRFAVINWHREPREKTTVLGKPRGPRTTLRMTPANLEDALAPAGLRQIRLVELPPYHYAAVFRTELTAPG